MYLHQAPGFQCGERHGQTPCPAEPLFVPQTSCPQEMRELPPWSGSAGETVLYLHARVPWRQVLLGPLPHIQAALGCRTCGWRAGSEQEGKGRMLKPVQELMWLGGAPCCSISTSSAAHLLAHTGLCSMGRSRR